MINKHKGNLLDITKGHIIHGCNAQGAMGSGVAGAIRSKYPGCFDVYRREYEEGNVVLGAIIPYVVNDDLVIWNAITQEYYGSDGTRYVSYDALEKAFSTVDFAMDFFPHIPKVLNFPLIGAGLGGGNWAIIESIIDNTISCEKNLWVLDIN